MKFNKKKVWTISGIVLGIIAVLLVIVYFSLSLIPAHQQSDRGKSRGVFQSACVQTWKF